MQLVFTVTVALVAVVTTVTMVTMVGAECGVNYHCRRVDKNIEVTACGVSEMVETTVCEGNCFNQDIVNLGSLEPLMQKVCGGHWLKEKKLVSNCSEAVTIWRAESCFCGPCLTQNMDCENLDSSSCSD